MIIHQTHNSQGNYTYNAFIYENCDWFYHFHKNYELIYVLQGQVTLTLNGRNFPVEAGNFALVLPNEFHAYRTPNTSRVWIGVFSSDFVGEFAKMTEGKQSTDPRFSCSDTVQAFLLTHLVTEEPSDILLTKAMLYAACGEFFAQAQFLPASQEQDFVFDIIYYVSAHFREDLSLKEIAKRLGYEYHYLSRQFHRHFDMNFKQFLNIYRMDHAREQLLHSDASITDIAYSAGFQTLRSFNRVFAEHTGMTPTNFRRKQPRLRRQQRNADGTVSYSESQ